MSDGADPTNDDRVAVAAARLYGLPPSRIVAARDEEVRSLKGSGDAALAALVKAFPRPSASAGLVNLLVRADTDLLADVRDVGHRLRAAQSDPDTPLDERRALDRERRALVDRCAQAAADVAATADLPASAASLREVEQTFWAALVDARALDAVAAGTLVRALAPAGFGEVDLEGASATVPPVDDPGPVRPSRPAGIRSTSSTTSRARDAARRDLEAAEDALKHADDDSRRLEEAVSAADRDVDDRRSEIADLRQRLATAEDALRDATSARDDLQVDLRSAERARRAAVATREKAARRARALGDDA